MRPQELRQRAVTATCAVLPLRSSIGDSGADTRRHKRHNSGDRHRWERQLRQDLPNVGAMTNLQTFSPCRSIEGRSQLAAIVPGQL